jgi:hypothetical protein
MRATIRVGRLTLLLSFPQEKKIFFVKLLCLFFLAERASEWVLFARKTPYCFFQSCKSDFDLEREFWGKVLFGCLQIFVVMTFTNFEANL